MTAQVCARFKMGRYLTQHVTQWDMLHCNISLAYLGFTKKPSVELMARALH